MESTNAQKPYRNSDMYQLNKCTLCPFMTHAKSSFQRHLMKFHGVKLKGLEANETGYFANLGRVVSDYGIQEKFLPKEVFQHQCSFCLQKFKSLQTLRFHKDACKKQAKARKTNNFPVLSCNNYCGSTFDKQKNLNRHKRQCGIQKNICCQICSFKCFDMHRMQRHLIDKHNLVCRPVDEPDFEQALNGTPYTLERTVELESLPQAEELAYLAEKDLLPPHQPNLGVVDPSRHHRKPKRLFICQICNGEFIKQRLLNKHMKYDGCARPSSTLHKILC